MCVSVGKAETVPSSMTTSFTSISESEGESSNVLVLSNLTLDPTSISQVLQDLPYVEKGIATALGFNVLLGIGGGLLPW